MPPHPAGTLSLKELEEALGDLCKETVVWQAKQERGDIKDMKVRQLKERADHADQASAASAKADRLEAELRDMEASLATRADVRFGELLCKRKIKAGASAAPHAFLSAVAASATSLTVV